ncbi:hypothetical protein J3459_018096 [Metarhizium acridum]|uniref:Polyketide synthase, putative n=1 Tax=Metarhizium acridum (strain CQMa 102) TaxID=655827 RepID=E9DQX4_METAQ|nr:polyketide synthase, putative [Metarhizium acridum CQMa 102]EFY93652.1 polyketide synthase, putative [Metarhizium acridum CQMa 102]KAG8408235.1 hypothetical protein J3459_018096 [Metarhizium acridum]KAG8410264.1 hypothetical protein J3458_017979 [Metarhizium acridum]
MTSGEIETKHSQQHVIVPSVQGHCKTTLQRTISETIGPDELSVTFSSDLRDQHLRAAVRGHAVADVEICSSSLLLNMALSAAQYAYIKNANSQKMPVPLTFHNCYFHRGVALTEKPQIVQVTVTLTPSTKTTDIQYHCRTSDEYYEIGACQVALESASKPDQASFLVRSRMAALKAPANHRLGKRAVDRLFDNVVRNVNTIRG